MNNIELEDEIQYDQLDDDAVVEKLKEIESNLKEKSVEGEYKDNFDEFINEFTNTVDLIEKSVSVKNEFEEGVSEECVELFETFNKIYNEFANTGYFLENICDHIDEDSVQEKLENFVTNYNTCITQFNRVIEDIYEISNEISLFKLDNKVSLEELTEQLIEDLSQTYKKLQDYVVKIHGIFEKYLQLLEKCNDSVKSISNVIGELVLTEQKIQGKYWCIYQPGAAIFGVGKTEKEAWKDAEEWADDVSSKNWKQSFKSAPCSEELYNYINQHGTPEDWEEVNGVMVLTSEVEELNESIKSMKERMKEKS